MFKVKHLFHKAELWEASIARWFSDSLPDYEDRWGRRGQALLVFVGLLYALFAVVFKVVATSFLVALYWLLRLVLPFVYVSISMWFGVTSAISLSSSALSSLDQTSLAALSSADVIQLAPSALLIALYVTFYASSVYVVGKLYVKTVYSDE